MDVKDHYDKLYSDNEKVFGIEPAPIIKKIPSYLKHGSVIEFGAGEGRNSLYLASIGYDVTATDISAIAIERIKKQALKNNIDIDAKELDIRELELKKKYDIIICTYTLHLLLRSEAESFLRVIKNYTNEGGLNVIMAFTRDGDFFHKNPETNAFYLESGELKDIYGDWESLLYFEKKIDALAKREDGKPMVNVTAGIIAQKPVA